MSINWKQTIEFYYSRIIRFHNVGEKCNYIRLRCKIYDFITDYGTVFTLLLAYS